ncbi:MAG: hypothetical protein HGA96_00615 [Desulfobulbaceae bacterium]|nr:hypothetical protein [Desulfobulbaceae bacterium]
MSAIKSLAIGFMAFTLTGCGQLISEKLAVTSSTTPQTCTGKKIIVLPFADYSYEEDADRAFRRNVDIMDNLLARLSEKGFRLPVQEDLVKYLSDNGVVKLNSNQTALPASPGSVQSLLSDKEGWSPAFKAEIARVVNPNQKQFDPAGQGQSTALDKNTLIKIADNFNADLIMRGRIIRFELDEENTWDPLKRGLLPVLFGGSSRAMFGVTNSETYDAVGSALAGAALGSAIGSVASFPYDSSEKVNPDRINSSVWGLGGAGLGYMSSKGGHANQAAVQLRLWVQDPKTAEVIWTNSVKVLVKPQTIFAETREDKLFDTAINQAITALTKDFINKSKAVL